MPDNEIQTDLQTLWKALPGTIKNLTDHAARVVAADPTDSKGEAAAAAKQGIEISQRLRNATAQHVQQSQPQMAPAAQQPQVAPPNIAPGAPMAPPSPLMGVVPPPIASQNVMPPGSAPVYPPGYTPPPVVVNVNNGKQGEAGEPGQEGQAGQPQDTTDADLASMQAAAQKMKQATTKPEPVDNSEAAMTKRLVANDPDYLKKFPPQIPVGMVAGKDGQPVINPKIKAQQSQGEVLDAGKQLKQQLYDNLGIGRDMDLGPLSSAAHRSAVELEKIPYSDVDALKAFAYTHFGPTLGAKASEKGNATNLLFLPELARDSIKDTSGPEPTEKWQNPEIGKAVDRLNAAKYIADRDTGIKPPPLQAGPAIPEVSVPSQIKDWWNKKDAVTPPGFTPPPNSQSALTSTEQMRRDILDKPANASNAGMPGFDWTGKPLNNVSKQDYDKILETAGSGKATKDQLASGESTPGHGNYEVPASPAGAPKPAPDKGAPKNPWANYADENGNISIKKMMKEINEGLSKPDYDEFQRRVQQELGNKPKATLWDVIGSFFANLSRNPEAMKIANHWYEQGVAWEQNKARIGQEMNSKADQQAQFATHLLGSALQAQTSMSQHQMSLAQAKDLHDQSLQETVRQHYQQHEDAMRGLDQRAKDFELANLIRKDTLDERIIRDRENEGTISRTLGAALQDALKRGVGYDPVKKLMEQGR